MQADKPGLIRAALAEQRRRELGLGTAGRVTVVVVVTGRVTVAVVVSGRVKVVEMVAG